MENIANFRKFKVWVPGYMCFLSPEHGALWGCGWRKWLEKGSDLGSMSDVFLVTIA
jgi:hypothetical protein